MALKDHDPDCELRRAIECSVAIECIHGYDVCPICDPCHCPKERVGIIAYDLSAKKEVKT